MLGSVRPDEAKTARIGTHGAAALVVSGLLVAASPAQAAPAPTDASLSRNPLDLNDWEIKVRAFAGYDDNVQLVPDEPPFFDPRADTGSAFAGISANAVIRFRLGPATDFGVSGRIDHLRYFGKQSITAPDFIEQDDQADYSLTTAAATAFVEQGFSVGGAPARLGMSYSFRHERAKVEAIGVNAHTTAGYFQVQPGRATTLRAAASYSWNDYSVDFTGIPTRDRDGGFLALDFTLTQRLTPRQTLSVGVGYIRNDAGRDWDYHGWRLSAALTTHIAGPVYARAGLAYTDSDYRGGFTDIVPGPGRTEQQLLDLGVGAYLYLSPDWVLDVGYRYQDFDANLPQFSGSRQQVTAGITWTI